MMFVISMLCVSCSSGFPSKKTIELPDDRVFEYPLVPLSEQTPTSLQLPKYEIVDSALQTYICRFLKSNEDCLSKNKIATIYQNDNHICFSLCEKNWTNTFVGRKGFIVIQEELVLISLRDVYIHKYFKQTNEYMIIDNLYTTGQLYKAGILLGQDDSNSMWEFTETNNKMIPSVIMINRGCAKIENLQFPKGTKIIML